MKPFIVIFGLAVALTGCKPSEPTIRAPELPVIKSRVTQVQSDTITRHQTISGIIRPAERATVSAHIMGRIKTARPIMGQTVNSGEILIEIEAGELDARLAQARAALDRAERDYKRELKLVTQGAAAQETLNAVADQRRIARAALQEAEAMQAYQKIIAPFDGVITGDFVNPGDLATPGQPLFELEGITQLRAEVPVSESLPLLKPDTKLSVILDDETIHGSLVELSPAASPDSRTRLAKIALPADTSAHSGQFVRVLWPMGDSTVLTIPADARSLFGQMERVYVVAEGKARMRLIKTGARHGDQVEVLSGLDAGETLILDPPSTLRDGQPVEIIP